MRPSVRPLILLFGDSITEQGFGMNGKVGWASLLAADYSRRADVLNRGFFGYNSKHAVDLLPSLPLSSGPLLFCTVYFGANDATTLGSRQYLPEDQFASNLSTIVTTIQSQSTSSRRPKTPIILLTPPPLDQKAWFSFKGIDNRSNERHHAYGAVVKEVAQKHDCKVLDVWKILEGDTSPDLYNKYLTDGLHLNELGNQKLYQGLIELIRKDFPDLAPQQDGEDSGIPLEEKLWEELC
jgi:isoamyl acetate esterase